MSINKISRSIVVAIFVALILFLGYFDIKYMGLKKNMEVAETSNLLKIGYFVALILVVSLYTYVREKLSKLKLQRPISTIYRYIYIVLVMLSTTFYKIYDVMGQYPKRTLILYFILTYFIGFFVQRIIFNISKSDVLSVLGMFIYYTLPTVIDDKTIDLNSKIIAIIVLFTIYIMQTLIDELKQLNIKNKRYIRRALFLSVLIGISTIIGVSYLIWIILAVILLFITTNLDSTSIKLSGKEVNKINKRKNNYFIYKVERVKISKLLVSLLIISVIGSSIYFTGRTLISNFSSVNAVFFNVVNELTVGIHSSANLGFGNFGEKMISFVGLSTMFYMVLFVYIIIMEVLALILRRKYDTKSTIIKSIFVLLLLIIAIYNLNILFYQPALTMLLIIIAIVNTTNIYYNREERIKMIEA